MTIKDQIPAGLLLRLHRFTHDPMTLTNHRPGGSSTCVGAIDCHHHHPHVHSDHHRPLIEDTVEVHQTVDERNRLVAEVDGLAAEKRMLLDEIADAESDLRSLRNEQDQVHAAIDAAEAQRPVSYAIDQTMLPVHDKDDAPPPPRRKVHEVFEYMYGSKTGSLMDLLA